MPLSLFDKRKRSEAAAFMRTRGMQLLCLGISLCLLASCALPPVPFAPESDGVGQNAQWEEIGEQPVPLANAPGSNSTVRRPATGDRSYSSNGGTIDVSNVASGYVMCKYSGGGKIKVLVTRSGGKQYSYNLNAEDSYEVFPLTSGNGTYTIGIYKNVSGNQYAQVVATSVEVSLSSSVIPYLYPNQYVNFNSNSATVAKGVSLSQGASNDLEVVKKVYDYVVNNISYDTGKASQVVSGQLSGYLPRVDNVLSAGKGICFDYAAVMAAMLRSQNIPTRLEVGYVSNGAYHAWISVYIADTGWVNDAIYFDGQSWKLMDPTFASSGGQTSAIMQYIGNGSNYSVQYLY